MLRVFSLKQLVRVDGEKFQLTARLHELPPSHDYWLGSYQAVHETWGTMTFTLTIPKSLAPTIDYAEVILQGNAEDQVRSLLLQANSKGRPLDMTLSPDGWVLV